MLSITEGIRFATGNSNSGCNSDDVSIPYCASSNNRDSIFNKNLDKLERKIINKLQRCKIDGIGCISAINHKQRSPKGQILVSATQEQWSRYFELGMYWFSREEGNHKALTCFKRCLQLNPEHETANYYVWLILQKQGRYQESLEAYQRAISLRSDEGFYYYIASQIYTALEEPKEAIEMIDKAIALSPQDIAYRNMKEHILQAFGIEQGLVDITLEHCNNDHLTTGNSAKY